MQAGNTPEVNAKSKTQQLVPPPYWVSWEQKLLWAVHDETHRWHDTQHGIQVRFQVTTINMISSLQLLIIQYLSDKAAKLVYQHELDKSDLLLMMFN